MKRFLFLLGLVFVSLLTSSCKEDYIIAGSIAIDGTEIYFKYFVPLDNGDPIDITAKGSSPDESIYILTNETNDGNTHSKLVDSIISVPYSTTVSFDTDFSGTQSLVFLKGTVSHSVNIIQ